MKLPVSIAFILCVTFQSLAQDFYLEEAVLDHSYDEIADRLSCMEQDIPLHFNNRVFGFIQYFAIKDRAYTQDIVDRKELYFPIFEAALKKYNLPDELKYLAIVESGLRPQAISRANAVGLWQFIYSTGSRYGLSSDWYIDERMDPYEATDAACRHLRDLHRMFGDWELALAAYNCGPGNVRKAIRRSGYKKEFWKIYRYLPRETRSYVPQFVAITYLLNHLELHGFSAQPTHFHPAFDTLQISQYFHLETFCNQTGLCLDDVLSWNPQIKRGALPEGTRNFALNIPADWKDTLVAKRKTLYDSAAKVGKKQLDYLARNTPGSTYGRTRIYHKVKSGDVLGTLSQRYGVRISDIRRWNKLRGNMIRIGQTLSIWVLPTYQSSTKKQYASQPTATKKPASAAPSGGSVYKVRYGDSLWSISRSTNTTIAELKLANKLSSNTIKAGQSLVIPN